MYFKCNCRCIGNIIRTKIKRSVSLQLSLYLISLSKQKDPFKLFMKYNVIDILFGVGRQGRVEKKKVQHVLDSIGCYYQNTTYILSPTLKQFKVNNACRKLT